ncbi:Two-component sensory histidine kinase (Drug sensor/ATP binding) [Desulfamplus magnetovallimortis]|uniref:histidine kinase n=1 Tax=Desulfamplus magnetovallimortis TaxID=1246637 RepID=A0A1W1H8N5_9BACT|nr:ATP-binding protein [Desulfamplus magnetovallimortis]SLM28819.1 Two-component sensory histidine kinase (Drug sensor/ATP binding) [Desulfamplus magnetovallimortis]
MIFNSLGIRDKLIGIFVLIKVIPLIVLAWFAWDEISSFSSIIEDHVDKMAVASRQITSKVGALATKDSIQALDIKARESIERLTTDTARTVADFLYQRDNDITFLSKISPDENLYRSFISSHVKPVTFHTPWVLNKNKDAWIPSEEPLTSSASIHKNINLDEPSTSSDSTQKNINLEEPTTFSHSTHKNINIEENKTEGENKEIQARNSENALDFHYRSPEKSKNRISTPLYIEITFVDLQGKEKIKVTSSKLLPDVPLDISKVENTFCKAENYFSELKKLKPGEIYVSPVIGAYVKTHMIGTYTPSRAEKAGIEFSPETSAYAGKENPVGKRFQGLVRWATPLVENGAITGYVTMALDHTHIMEFSDHIVPTEERYSDISDAGSGNYAFIWDYHGRNISHPRDYFITGYDPETGEPAVPWMEEKHYQQWIESGAGISDFLATLPVFQEQSIKKKPASELTRAGLVGLDCRYLNFAPQCDGWNNITQEGGSGSFSILWSGLKKMTTAATIPYYTGRYGKNPRGFGFVTIGANVDEFHKAAIQTADAIQQIQNEYHEHINQQNLENQRHLDESLRHTSLHLTIYTFIMVVMVIMIAVFMASTLTATITRMIDGLKKFQEGDLSHRLNDEAGDEIGQLSRSFNSMADTIQHTMNNIIDSMPSILTGIDRSGNVTLWNREAGLISGIEAKDAVGQSVFELFPFLASEKKIVFQAIEEGIITKNQKRKTLFNSKTYYMDVTVYPLLDPEGTDSVDGITMAVGAVLRVDNVTARVRMEERMVQAEKMQSIGSLAAGMAHEINNPLAGIIQNAQLIKNRIQEDLPRNRSAAKECGMTMEQLIEYGKKRHLFTFIESIMNASRRAADIVENMLSFSRKSDPHFTESRLSEILERTVEISKKDYDLKNRFNFSTIEFIRIYDSNTPQVKCNVGKIEQVFFNILKNGAQAMMNNSSIGKKNSCFVLKERAEKENVIIEIQDNGHGMDESIRKRIFEPFFTTKSVGTGTGLGLYICYFIINDEHNGSITVTSQPGKGTTFRISLPSN